MFFYLFVSHYFCLSKQDWFVGKTNYAAKTSCVLLGKTAKFSVVNASDTTGKTFLVFSKSGCLWSWGAEQWGQLEMKTVHLEKEIVISGQNVLIYDLQTILHYVTMYIHLLE